MKKKSFNIQKFLLWGGIPSVIIAIGTFVISSSKTITVYAQLPQDLAQTKSEVSQIAEYIKQQQTINNYIHEKEVSADKAQTDDPQANQYEPVISPDGKYQYNQDTQKWELIKKKEIYNAIQ